MDALRDFDANCRWLERHGYERTTEDLSTVDETQWRTVRALHPDGSHIVFKRRRASAHGRSPQGQGPSRPVARPARSEPRSGDSARAKP